MNSILPVIATVLSFFVTTVLGFFIIPTLHKMKYGQTILDIGPKWHQSKQGTPTMGGILFIIGTVFSLVAVIVVALITKNCSLYDELTNGFEQKRILLVRLIAGIVMALAFGFVGFIDDYIKVVKKRNLGLTARQKTIIQFLIGVAFLATLILAGDGTTNIPFVGMVNTFKGVGLIFWPIALLFIYGFVNSVNLTDGIDGLCSSVTLVVSLFYMLLSGVLAYSGLNILSCALAGAMGGFLVWNLKPAKVFMGDTGSLFLGGMVVAMSFISGYPVLLILSGILYLIEALSDIIQVAYYKKTKKRIFKMAPIHHHFEMCGWSENKIVVVFSSITLVGCLLAFVLYYFG